MPKSKPRAKKPPHIREKNVVAAERFEGSPTPGPAPIRTFQSDWRMKNPKLHNYYVHGAYEDLKLAQDVACVLEERARTPCYAMAHALRQAMREEIESDAAFFEAAALLFAGLEPPKED